MLCMKTKGVGGMMSYPFCLEVPAICRVFEVLRAGAEESKHSFAVGDPLTGQDRLKHRTKIRHVSDITRAKNELKWYWNIEKRIHSAVIYVNLGELYSN